MSDSDEKKTNEQESDAVNPETENENLDEAVALSGDEEKKTPLSLEVQVETRSACERHVLVKISREDVERYFAKQFDELAPKAEVPGFRPGKAPRKLLESKFRHQVADQVKGELLLDCMTQVNEEQDFSAISEPDFDFGAVDIPDEGPMTFEFDIEVRPEFDMPEWKGMKIERPTKEFTDEDINGQLKKILAKYADMVPCDDEVKMDDFIVANIASSFDGKEIAIGEELTIQVRPSLSFPDAIIDDFDKAVVGAKAGAKKTVKAKVSSDCEDEELRGQEIDLEIEILDVKRQEFPDLDTEMLATLGGFEDEAAVRETIKSELERQLVYHQNKSIREQIAGALTQSADWELPPELLRRQAGREVERAILELRSSGFGEAEIRAYENDLRQNSMRSTENALKEHFILESIAESENVEENEDDFNQEIALIAMQQNESPRRVRARLEKKGQMDSLRNQIIERKVLDLIKEHAEFNDTEFELDDEAPSAVDFFVSGSSGAEIPEAKYEGGADQLATTGKK